MPDSQKAKPRSKCFAELLTAAQELMYDSAVIRAWRPHVGRLDTRNVCSGCSADLDDSGKPSSHHRDCKVGRLQDAVHAYIGYGDDDD